MTDTDQTLPRSGSKHEAAPDAGAAPAKTAAERNSHSPGAKAPGDEPGAGAGAAGGPVESVDEQERAPAELELEGDLDELVRTAAQRDEYLALAQRTQADFENYRKRVAREAQAAQQRGMAGLARELLPALDNLDRALDAASRDDPLLDGVRLVRAELSAALARAGIESFSPLGEVFDPSVHEAMATAEQLPEGSDSGTVVEVYQQGYRIGSNVIRPARVVVAA
jgi:molecular chaperone GrpE